MNVIQIRQIKLPSQNYRVGRPKGSGRTVVGTRKKEKKKQQAVSSDRVTRSTTQKRSAKTQIKSKQNKKKKV